jgi:hypothetical protein
MFEEIKPITDLRVIAEGYAREWEAYARTIRNYPALLELGGPGSAEFDGAFDAAITLDNGNVGAELDEEIDDLFYVEDD